MNKKSNIRSQISHYLPLQEVSLMLFSILLSTIATTLNFAYGKKAITTKIFIASLLLVNLISHLIMLRNIYYRLRSTSLSSRIYHDLELLLTLQNGKSVNQQLIAERIKSYSSEIDIDAKSIFKQLNKPQEDLFSKNDDVEQQCQDAISKIDNLIQSNHTECVKKQLEKIKKKIQILDGLHKLKNIDNKTSAKSSSAGIVILLNKYVTATVITCGILQGTSIFLMVSAPILRNHQIIKNPLYFAMIFTAYGFLTIATTIFTINRVVDRKVKRENHKKVSILFHKQELQENGGEADVTHLDHLQKLEIAFNFLVDTITRGADIIINFLYSSHRVNFITYVSVSFALELCGFLMILYSTYDRFSALKLAEEDKEKLSAINSISGDNNESTNMSLMLCIVCIMYPLSVIGKNTVQVFYKNNKLSNTLYFALTFITILCSSSVRFIFNINRYIDTEVTDVNHNLVIDQVLQKVELNNQTLQIPSI